MIIEIDTINKLKEMLAKHKYSIVKLYAPWCGPCKLMKPQFKNASEEIKAIKFIEINIDVCPKIKDEYDIGSVPTVLLFYKDKLIDQFVGFKNSSSIIEFILKNTINSN